MEGTWLLDYQIIILNITDEKFLKYSTKLLKNMLLNVTVGNITDLAF